MWENSSSTKHVLFTFFKAHAMQCNAIFMLLANSQELEEKTLLLCLLKALESLVDTTTNSLRRMSHCSIGLNIPLDPPTGLTRLNNLKTSPQGIHSSLSYIQVWISQCNPNGVNKLRHMNIKNRGSIFSHLLQIEIKKN